MSSAYRQLCVMDTVVAEVETALCDSGNRRPVAKEIWFESTVINDECHSGGRRGGRNLRWVGDVELSSVMRIANARMSATVSL